MIASSQCSCKGVIITVEEGLHFLDALVVKLFIDHREGLVWKFLDEFFNGE